MVVRESHGGQREWWWLERVMVVRQSYVGVMVVRESHGGWRE